MKSRKWILAVGCALLLSSSALAGNGTIRRSLKPVEDLYIVELAEHVPAAQARSAAAELARLHQGKVEFVYDSAVRGFSIEMTEDAAQRMAGHPLVANVEEAAEVSLSQTSATIWHVDRVDQRNLPLDGYSAYIVPANQVYAYVVDSGVLSTHKEFWTSTYNTTSRVLPGKDFTSSTTPNDATATNPCPGWTHFSTSPCASNDRYCVNGGHGTAVASLIAGRSYGLIKANIVPIRTHSCHGTSTTTKVTRAVDWLYANAASLYRPAVVNMSFETPVAIGSAETTLEASIRNLIAHKGIPVVVAAGNGNVSVLGVSPARMSRANGGKVITAAGSTTTDRRWKCNSANTWETCSTATAGSNYGAVDIFAPAQNIPSANIKEPAVYTSVNGPEMTCCYDSTTAERQVLRSGTSFAAPLVTAVALQKLGANPALTPDEVWNIVRADATVNVMPTTTDADSGPLNGSPNVLLYLHALTKRRAVSQ